MRFTDSVLEAPNPSDFSIDDFLAAEAGKDLLRFSTAGSVDDGKSTLIGRLLYDSRSVYEDHIHSVAKISPGSSQPTIDFALLTDGLRAEREQGITIDVAYRFFATQRRKFIIADTPGHEQYTRNMATGASTADLAIILIDARKGILTQSRRHAYIASLLGIRHLVAAINKMDLVGFSEDAYRSLSREFAELAEEYGSASVTCIPVSALDGDNVVERSDRTPWYDGTTLLEYLEQAPVGIETTAQPFRMPVQRVIRPNHNYRGFAGQIACGTLRPGDTVVALPSGRSSTVTAITTFDGDLAEAAAPLSVAFTLADELDISRGDLIVSPDSLPRQATVLEASLVWFDTQRLETHTPYLLKHGTSTLRSRVTRVLHRTNIHTLAEEPVSSLAMNEIGVAELELTRPIFFDAYTANRSMGSFILIDPHTNATLAAGMIRRGTAEQPGKSAQRAALIGFTAGSTLSIAHAEQHLLAEGALVVRTGVRAEETLRALLSLGLIVLLEGEDAESALRALPEFHPLDAQMFASAEALVTKLRRSNVLAAESGRIA
jgi:sulfate adenylyltransferase subunit 1